MKLIHKFKSLNYNERKTDKINLIIIHYTALKSISESIKYLTSKKNKVSCHYIISQKGNVYSLVSEKKRAWHAGQSYWRENVDINSSSIGIELDYYAQSKDAIFSKVLINSLTELLMKIMSKYSIPSENILAHSDISPYRKVDPGKNFPWNLLEEKKVAFQIINLKKKSIRLIKYWFIKNKFNSNEKKILFMLSYIGYDISLASINKSSFKILIMNYVSRFNHYKNYNFNKKNIHNLIEIHFLNILLTKLKK